jgi:hypothetical protein
MNMRKNAGHAPLFQADRGRQVDPRRLKEKQGEINMQ